MAQINHNNPSTKEQIERSYEDFSNMLDSFKQSISSLTTTNPNFTKYQKGYNKQLSDQVSKTKLALADMRKYAIWDKLVIAFIGVTNAGKSTIIECFRILFDEPERKAALWKCPSGVDGMIIGDGRADFTRTYKEYNMSIGGKNFVLIDVPGIEGNEGEVKSEILKALGKAHCVFYVQGEGKKPDAETVKKIKDYLKDWVKVYSIYNVKGTAFNYDEEDERALFKNKDIKKVEKEIANSMNDALGRNYVGNITIQARLALCSYAKFAKGQNELISEQNDLLDSFGSPASMFSFSNFTELQDKVDYLSNHFADEILEAQTKKLYKLHVDAFSSLNRVNDCYLGEINRIINQFQDCRTNVQNCFNFTQGQIKSKVREEIESMFNDLEIAACSYIDAGKEGDELTKMIAKKQKSLSERVERNTRNIISNEAEELRKSVDNEISRLKGSFNGSTIYGNYSVNINVELNKVISELEFCFGDLINWGMLFGGAFAAGWAFAAGANWWNPIGWALMAIGAFFAIVNDDKQDKAKAKLKEKLMEAKTEFYNTKWIEIANDLDTQLSSKLNLFDQKIVGIINDFICLKNYMDSVKSTIKKNSKKYIRI